MQPFNNDVGRIVLTWVDLSQMLVRGGKLQSMFNVTTCMRSISISIVQMHTGLQGMLTTAFNWNGERELKLYSTVCFFFSFFNFVFLNQYIFSTFCFGKVERQA